jgi:hypothetical protein
MHHPAFRLIWATALLIMLIGGGRCALAQTAWYEGFEGPETSWCPAGANVRWQAEFHGRVQGEARTGDGCERLRISAAEGNHIYFAHDIGRARIIDELIPTVQVRADRPGIQLFARVVLPRTQDPGTRRPVAMYIPGSTYKQSGRWEQLHVDGIPQSLMRQTRVLRTQLGPSVDPREAYVDQVVLNVYSGPGVASLWIDDLDVAGYVAADPVTPTPVTTQTASLPRTGSLVPVRRRENAEASPSRRGRIQLNNSILSVDGRPTFVRAVQYQGEPLALLKQLGFNVVWLPQLASTEFVDQAREQGLWLICPPPRQPVATGLSPVDEAIPPIGPAYDRVLVWDLGSGLSRDRLATTRQWAEQVQLADRQGGRPLICRPESELRAYSHPVDLLLIGRSPIGTSLELNDYGTWVRERPRLARPGTPIWTTVQTQPAPSLVQQWQVLGRGATAPTTMAAEQIRLMVYTAVTAGSRGLLFESQSPLSADDPDTQQRAMALELLNLELDLIEPWLAAGNFVATVSADKEPEVIGGVLQAEHARLLVPLWSARGAQFVSGQAAGKSISFIVPGIPEASQAYVLTPGGLEPIRRKRDTGGVRVTIDEFGLTSLVLFTSEQLVVNSLSRRAAQVGQRAAELQHRLAQAKLREVQQVGQQLAGSRIVDAQVPGWLGAAQQNLQHSKGLLASRQYSAAYLFAERAMRSLRLAQRSCWEAAINGLRSPISSPAAVGFRTLPWHRELTERVSRGPSGENRLPEGQFEDLGSMLQVGWNHFQHPIPGLQSEANLAPAAAHAGRFGLRLAARPATPATAQTLVESPPVWITSPAVPVEAGEVVVIHGWIQIPTPLTGSVDGLLILDSISGEPLAERIGETVGWQEFTLYRVVPQAGQMSLTFALSGMGEAWLDDVTIQTLR